MKVEHGDVAATDMIAVLDSVMTRGRSAIAKSGD